MLMFSFNVPFFLRLVKLVIRRNVEHKTETEQKFGKDKNDSHFIFVLSYFLYLYIYIVLLNVFVNKYLSHVNLLN